MPAVISPALTAAERDLLALLHADARLTSARTAIEDIHDTDGRPGIGAFVSITGTADDADRISRDLYDRAAEIEREHRLPPLTIGIVVSWF